MGSNTWGHSLHRNPFTLTHETEAPVLYSAITLHGLATHSAGKSSWLSNETQQNVSMRLTIRIYSSGSQ